MQLSKNLPRVLVDFDQKWPSSPQPLKDASASLKEMYRMSLVRKFMRRLSPEDRAQVCIYDKASHDKKGHYFW